MVYGLLIIISLAKEVMCLVALVCLFVGLKASLFKTLLMGWDEML